MIDILLNVKDEVFHINYMSNMASVLWEAGVACPSRAPEFTPVFGKARIAHLFSFLCCVFVFVGLRHVLCLPNVASFSGLSIHDCLFGFL